MPLTAKGEEILSKMEKEYGSKKGEKVFYATKNAGKISGVDAVLAKCDAVCSMADAEVCPRCNGKGHLKGDIHARCPQCKATGVVSSSRSDADKNGMATITIECRDDDEQLSGLLTQLKKASDPGHSFTVVVDPDLKEQTSKFFIDGDGSFRIHKIKYSNGKKADGAGDRRLGYIAKHISNLEKRLRRML